MSGPNPPGPESDELDPGVGPSQGDSEFEAGGNEFGKELAGDGSRRGQRDGADRYLFSGLLGSGVRTLHQRPVCARRPGPLRLRELRRASRPRSHVGTLAMGRRHRRDCRSGRPGGIGIAAVRAHRHQQAGDAEHRAHVDAADAGRDHRHHTAAGAASAADQRGSATTAAADQRGAATATAADRPRRPRTGPRTGTGPRTCTGPGTCTAAADAPPPRLGSTRIR